MALAAFSGRGSETDVLTENAVRALLEAALGNAAVDNRRLLVIIPDLTRSAPIPLFFRLLYEILGERAARLSHRARDPSAAERRRYREARRGRGRGALGALSQERGLQSPLGQPGLASRRRYHLERRNA